jgi:protein-disulfide isomerase
MTKPQPDWLTYANGGHRVGPADAKAVLITFSDYQCPYCKRLEESIRSARARYPADFAVVYRQWPMPQIHPYAFNAAVASECAANQGAFEAMHRLLFDLQDSLGSVLSGDLAARAHISNRAMFNTCMRDSATAALIRKDMETGKGIGVGGTPAVLMNGVQFRGAILSATLDSLIRIALSSSASSQGLK